MTEFEKMESNKSWCKCVKMVHTCLILFLVNRFLIIEWGHQQ